LEVVAFLGEGEAFLEEEASAWGVDHLQMGLLFPPRKLEAEMVVPSLVVLEEAVVTLPLL
jgi:hypothetical protein